MTEKQKLGDISSELLNKLQNSGLTYKQLMGYGLTRWGARKVGNHSDITQETNQSLEKVFAVRDEVDDLTSLKTLKVPLKSTEVNHEEKRRSTTSEKQSITTKANNYLRELEEQVKSCDTEPIQYSQPEHIRGNHTAIIHETDPHFSAKVKNRDGNIIYDTETAAEATKDAFQFYTSVLLRQNQDYLDNIVILLGGDLVEGESIYEGQPHKVDNKLQEQIRVARKTYYECIKTLKNMFDVPVKVVCVSGNHGDLPVSSHSNADDLIYSMLEDMFAVSDTEDIKFVRSDRTDGITFNFRNWKGYLCHGENRRNHIGTSSPQSDWLALKDRHGFDAAWRGHYHNQKRENVNGAPVFMTNSRKPGDDYTDKIATFGKTGNAIYFSTDAEPVAEVVTETDVL